MIPRCSAVRLCNGDGPVALPMHCLQTATFACQSVLAACMTCRAGRSTHHASADTAAWRCAPASVVAAAMRWTCGMGWGIAYEARPWALQRPG